LWYVDDDDDIDVPPHPIDDIETYLDNLNVPTLLIEGQGGPMKY
jgi:hypothetical protein